MSDATEHATEEDVVQPATERPMFPAIEAENLLGETCRYPADLLGRTSLVLTVWTQEQQREADTWLASLARFDARGVDVIEHPVVPTRWRPMKRVVDGWMRDGIPGDSARRRTVTLFTSLRRHAARLGVVDRDEIDVVLVDDTGRIARRWRGAATGAAIDDVLATVDMLEGQR